jgi:uncharacterized membrane protein YhaH (DUF805 family)
MDQMFAPLRRYAEFGGRSRRLEFWSYFLMVTIAGLVLMYLDSALGLGGTATGYANESGAGFSMTGGILSLLFALAILVPSFAVAVRRIHDSGRSGWHLLAVVIPLFGWLYLLFLYVQPGDPGPNAYGPDPKGGGPGQAFT